MGALVRAPETTLGPYRILDVLGQGGMGVVYRGEHLLTGRTVALKTVRTAAEVTLAGIRREIHALGRVQHPGVVRIVDQGVSAGLPWYAMELLEGRTLGSHLQQAWARDGLDPEPPTAATRTRPMSEGLAATPGPAPASPRSRARSGRRSPRCSR
jgi:serine/threonine protein kinase